jgi:hypothetical protein
MMLMNRDRCFRKTPCNMVDILSFVKIPTILGDSSQIIDNENPRSTGTIRNYSMQIKCLDNSVVRRGGVGRRFECPAE